MEDQKTVQEISKKQWKWILGFNYFNCLDAALTVFVLEHLGGHEINPLMAMLYKAGVPYFVGFKLLLGLYGTLVLVRKKSWGSLKLFYYLFMGVCLWNIGQLIHKAIALGWFNGN